MDEAKELLSISAEDSRLNWESHINRAEQGQVSIRQYCRDHGLTEAQFYYWRKRLQGNKKKKAAFKSCRFSRVKVSEEVLMSRIRLELGQGVVLSFDQEPSPSWIKDLVTVLGGLS